MGRLEKQKRLILFTEIFPYKGGESFLETEILYLSRAFEEVVIVPEIKGETFYGDLPSNVRVLNIELQTPTAVRKLLFRNFLRLSKYFLTEVFYSAHRSKYLRNIKTHLLHLVSRLREAAIMKTSLQNFPESENRYYTYWFSEWTNRLLISGHKRVISRVHLFDFEEEFREEKYLPFRYAEMRRIEKVYPISAYAKTYLEERHSMGGIGPVQHLGVPENKLNPGGAGEEYSVVSNSSLRWYKRPLLLMEVMKHITRKIHWVHFGDGALETDFLKAAESLPANIRFDYKGRVDNTQVIRHFEMQPVDLILNLSVFEGIPVSLMEGIAAGIPIVGCKVCGVPEIVTEQTGLLLEKEPEVCRSASIIDKFLGECRDLEYRKGVQDFWRENYNAERNYTTFTEKLKLN